MRVLWPWFTLAGLGMYHGVNPAMGWLFAVALGLHHGRRSVVVQSLIPIAIGHLLSIAAVAGAISALGVIIDRRPLLTIAGSGLILWALYHLAYGTRHQARIGLQTGFFALLAWSFLLASAHGAGLMLIPALIPLCLSGSGAGYMTAASSLIDSLAAVCIYTATMVSVSGIVAILVYIGSGRVSAARLDQFGLAVDRSARRHGNDHVRGLSSLRSITAHDVSDLRFSRPALYG
jgi:hypothetical protein